MNKKICEHNNLSKIGTGYYVCTDCCEIINMIIIITRSLEQFKDEIKSINWKKVMETKKLNKGG